MFEKQKQLLRCGEQPNHLPVNSYRPMFIFWWWFGPWYIPATPPIWWINTTQPTSSTPLSHSTSAAMGHDWRATHTGHRHRAFRSCNMAKTLEMAGVFPFVCSDLVFSCDKFHIIPCHMMFESVWIEVCKNDESNGIGSNLSWLHLPYPAIENSTAVDQLISSSESHSYTAITTRILGWCT